MMGLGFLGKLFGTDKAASALVNTIRAAGDALVYTDEEKAEDAAKQRKEGHAVFMEWLRSTSGSRLARRMLALGVGAVWGIEHISALAVKCYAVFAADPTKWERIGSLISEQANADNAIFGVVLLFYFGGPVAVDSVSGLVKKWAGQDKQKGVTS